MKEMMKENMESNSKILGIFKVLELCRWLFVFLAFSIFDN